MIANQRPRRMKNDEIVQTLCTEKSLIENLKTGLKDSIAKRPAEEMIKIGHGHPRSVMWIVEECSLSNDFYRRTVAPKSEGHNFREVVFNMLKNFDGFKGSTVSQDWMPPLDPAWDRFRFHLEHLRKYHTVLGNMIPGHRRVQMMVFMISVVLAVLEKHSDLHVTSTNLFSVFESFINQLVAYLLDAFVIFFPKVHDDLDRNAIRVDRLRRTRSFEDSSKSLHVAKLPDISWFLTNKNAKVPVVPAPAPPPNMPPPPYDQCPAGFLPYPTPVYYLPEEMHPSWCESFPVAPAPYSYVSAEHPIVKVKNEHIPLAALVRVPTEPVEPVAVLKPIPIHSLAPTPELPFVSIVIVSSPETSYNLKRKHDESESSEQLKRFVMPGDLNHPPATTSSDATLRQFSTGEHPGMTLVNNLLYTISRGVNDVEQVGESSGTLMFNYF